jgi:hypothetical protein
LNAGFEENYQWATLVAIWRGIADRVSRRKSNREVSLQELSSLTDDVNGLLTGKGTYGYSGTALGKSAEYRLLILGGQSHGVFIFGRLG